jgi:uncharacterized protein YcbX
VAQPDFRLRFFGVGTLARLSVTQVKGLRLSHPAEVELTSGGIPADRRFFLVDEDDALFSAADHGGLIRIVPDYDASSERLRLSFPDGTEAEGAADALDQRFTTDFWGRAVVGRVVRGPFADPLSAYVGRPIRLARVERDGEGQDVRPLTIVSSESVGDLGTRGRHDGLDARRFRINLEVRGYEPYEEDSWDGLLVRIGEAAIRVRGQIPRCVVTTLGPDTGEKDFRTLNEIARYRPRIGGRGGLPFGMYAEAEEPGRVRVGDEVEPLSSPRSGTRPAAGP